MALVSTGELCSSPELHAGGEPSSREDRGCAEGWQVWVSYWSGKLQGALRPQLLSLKKVWSRSCKFPGVLPIPRLKWKMNYDSLQWFHWKMSCCSASVMSHVLWKRLRRFLEATFFLKRQVESFTSPAILLTGGQSSFWTIIAAFAGNGVDS